MPQARATFRQKNNFTTEQALENFAAALVETIYPVVLRQEAGKSWMDLELALWKVITETVNGRGTQVVPPERGAM